MAPVKFNRVISYSSEDPIHKAENLLNPVSVNKWKCNDKGESESVVVLELPQQLNITSLDIGNEFSAFIKVLVGKSCCDEYETLLPTVSMMGPQESKTGVNTNSVRFFKEDSLLNTKDTWDKIKVVCTQPYNKYVQYGIAFITVHSNDLDKDNNIPTPINTANSVNENGDLNKTGSPKEAFTVSYKNGQFTTYLVDEPALKPPGYFFAKRKQLLSPPKENRIKIKKLDSENEQMKNYSITTNNTKKDVKSSTAAKKVVLLLSKIDTTSKDKTNIVNNNLVRKNAGDYNEKDIITTKIEDKASGSNTKNTNNDKPKIVNNNNIHITTTRCNFCPKWF